jgi:hypothetical protein
MELIHPSTTSYTCMTLQLEQRHLLGNMIMHIELDCSDAANLGAGLDKSLETDAINVHWVQVEMDNAEHVPRGRMH